MTTLEKAISISLDAHKGQNDKSGLPYILHPLRVMLKMDTTEEMIPAVLHDVLEDTQVDQSFLLTEGIPDNLVNIVISLSRKEGEDYLSYIKRIKPNPIAAKIKLADITDNANILRLTEVDNADLERLNNYLQAIRILSGRK